MSKRPSSVELLETARDVLLAELLPAVPDDKRYAARMVANAIAIARREIDGAAAELAAELASLEAVYTADDVPEEHRDSALRAQRDVLNARLAADLRAGRLDAASGIHSHLLERVRARLRSTNPRYLDATDSR